MRQRCFDFFQVGNRYRLNNKKKNAQFNSNIFFTLYEEKLISKSMLCLKEGRKIPLHGDGSYVRDWIYVEDHCEAIYKILMTGKNRQIYNVSSSEELSNIEVTEKLLKLMGLDKNMINYVEDRLGHDFRYSISANKIKNDLGFTAKTNFGDGLQKTLEWYKKRSD